jgi:hypothetical protein
VIIGIIIIYIVYLIILILGSYYVNLYLSKEQFTKEELKDVIPYLAKLWNSIANNYSMVILTGSIIVASIVGIVLTMLTQHWFLNSAIIFAVMFFVFPLAKKNFDKAMVTTGGNLSDTVMNIFLKYYNFILIGFGAGTASGLMYNWGAFKAVHFLWFLINIIALTILIGITIKNIANQ